MHFRHIYNVLPHLHKTYCWWQLKSNEMFTEKQKIENAIIELSRSMSLAADREEYQSAADMKRISMSLHEPCERTFTEKDISLLQTSVHKITGDGEVMMLFNSLLGIAAS